MFDFLIRKFVIKNAQKFIDKLQPKVSVQIPMDLPLPSVGVIKKMCLTVSQINSLEAKMEKLSDQQLRAKTDEFRAKYKDTIKQKREELDKAEEFYRAASSSGEREEHRLVLY